MRGTVKFYLGHENWQGKEEHDFASSISTYLANNFTL